MVSFIIRVFAIIASIVAFYGWTATQGEMESLAHAISQERAGVERAEAQVNALQTELTLVTNDRANLRAKLTEAEQRAQRLTAQLSQNSLALKHFKEDLALATIAQEKMAAQNQILRQEINSSLDVAYRPATAEVETLKSTVALLESKIDLLQLRNREAEEHRANQASASNPAPTHSPYDFMHRHTQDKETSGNARQTASILKIDYRNGLIILGLGTADGYHKDMEMSLLKDLEKPVRVRIQSAQNDFSIATLLPGSHIRTLSERDVVEILK